MKDPASSAADPVQEHSTGYLNAFLGSRLGVLIVVPGLVLVIGIIFICLGQTSLAVSVDANIHGKSMDLARETRRIGTAWTGAIETALARLAKGAGGDAAAVDRNLPATGEALQQGSAPLVGAGLVLADGSIRHLALGRSGTGGSARNWTRSTPGASAFPWLSQVDRSGAVAWIDVAGQVIAAQAVRDSGTGARLAVAYLEVDQTDIVDEFDGLAMEAAMRPPPKEAASPAGPMPSAPASESSAHTTILLGTADGRIVVGRDRTGEAGHGRRILAAVAPHLTDSPQEKSLDISVDGKQVLAGLRRLDASGTPAWYAIVVVEPEEFAAPALGHLHRALLVGLVVLALSVGLAMVLARYIARQRQIAARAKAVAMSAEQRLRALGSYRLIRRLGEGGMGSVWVAEHELLARPAAVKRILPEVLGADEETRSRVCARFEREAKVTANLRSRHTVTLYDYGLAADGSFYYAMELLDGTDLDRLVRRFGPQPQGRVASILAQACRSLGEAHEQGMVHRDIKPGNIFLCRMGGEVDIIKVLDFGLVAESTPADPRRTRPGFVLGTPACMAPEQARGLTVDARADIYALGCVAYWLLTGREVFQNDSPIALMAAHLTEQPAPLDDTIAPELAQLVMAMLAKDPAQRPPSASAILAALATSDRLGWDEKDALAWWSTFGAADSAGPATEASGSAVLPARASSSPTIADDISVLLPGELPGR